MKILILILLVGCFAPTAYKVILLNGEEIVAKEPVARGFKRGDTVCVKQFNNGNWYIDAQRIMKDTSFIDTSKGIDLYIIYKIGVIK